MQTWNGHALLGLRAAEGLPSWEIGLLKPDMSEAEIGKPFMPPIRNVREKLGAYCLILDWIYQREYSRYGRQADGRWIPHGPANADFTAQGEISETANHILIAQLMQAMIDALKSENWEEAIRRGGALGHFLQEPFTPGHSTCNELFEQFFPDPDPRRHWRLHTCFDSASGDFAPPCPALMGTSAEEAAFYLFNVIKKGIRSGRALIGPVVEAAYRGRTIEENRMQYQALLRRQSEMSSFITASAWHTAFCIAFQRFAPGEAERFRECDLTALEPYYLHPSKYVHLTPGRLVDADGWLIPLDVWGENRSERHFERGFGLFGHSGCKFYVNGLFSKVRFQLGLPSRMLDGQNEHTELHFSIETDKKENRLFSEDIEYQAARRLEVCLKAFAPVREYEVDIRGAATLIFASRCIPYTDGAGVVRYACPDLAIIDPVLVKG